MPTLGAPPNRPTSVFSGRCYQPRLFAPPVAPPPDPYRRSFLQFLKQLECGSVVPAASVLKAREDYERGVPRCLVLTKHVAPWFIAAKRDHQAV